MLNSEVIHNTLDLDELIGNYNKRGCMIIDQTHVSNEPPTIIISLQDLELQSTPI